MCMALSIFGGKEGNATKRRQEWSKFSFNVAIAHLVRGESGDLRGRRREGRGRGRRREAGTIDVTLVGAPEDGES